MENQIIEVLFIIHERYKGDIVLNHVIVDRYERESQVWRVLS